MKPNEYRVGGEDSVGNKVKTILGMSDAAAVYTTENGELRWENNDDGTLPPAKLPAVTRFDTLLARIKTSGITQPQRDEACVLLGKCLFQALNSDVPSAIDELFRPIEKFLAVNTAQSVWKRIWKIVMLKKLSWPVRLASVLLVILFCCVTWAWVDALLARRESAFPTLCPSKEAADELVVLVHGYGGSFETMEGVIQAIHEQRPRADILFFNYPARLFSNKDPFVLAKQLDEEIAQQDKPQYKTIILSGHSIGAILVRKAYMYGCGSIEDMPPVSAGSTTRPPRDWCKKVTRIVLLAGMNRGWNPDAPASLSWITNKLGILLARLTGTATFIRSFERGEPFVANLRLQWLTTMKKARDEGSGLRPPVVVQLLGDEDDLVSKDDSRDVTVTHDFICVGVNHTGHSSLLQLSETGVGLERKRRIQSSFGGDADIEKLKQANPVVATETDTDVTTVVFVLHGIRDMGEWTSQFKQPLEEGFASQHQGTKEKIYVDRAAYGYFPMGAFLLWGDRQRNVRWFMDQVTELKARFPNLKSIDFIGHSNGTYVLASALEKYQTLSVDRVVLAGSVIRRDFQWSKFTRRVNGVRNYVGSADWVVGLFPKLFELPGLSAFNPDIGSAGYNGFEDGYVKDDETQFIKGGHGAALVESNVPSIVDFILEGKKTEVSELLVKEHPGLLNLASRLCWLIWLGLFVISIALGFLVTVTFNGRLPAWLRVLLTPKAGQDAGRIRAFFLSCLKWTSNYSQLRGRIALAAYCGIIIYLINTV